MTRHTSQYHVLLRQVAKRRRDLLRSGPSQLLFPPLGQNWTPSDRELALCDAFIVFFVAELETYFESVIDTSLNLFEDGFRASSFSDCGAASEFVGKIVAKRKQWARNNNTNWSRTSEYWDFVGLSKSKFPTNLWDYVEQVAKDRGDIAHNSLGVRVIIDPRLTFAAINNLMRDLAMFDRDFNIWQEAGDAELARLGSVYARFVPGLGMIAPR